MNIILKPDSLKTAERKIYLAEQERRSKYWANIDAEDKVYKANVEKVQKKLKNLRKKFRDIGDLENKKSEGIKLSVEQKEKLSKKSQVTLKKWLRFYFFDHSETLRMQVSSEIELLEDQEREILSNPPIVDQNVPKPDDPESLPQLESLTTAVAVNFASTLTPAALESEVSVISDSDNKNLTSSVNECLTTNSGSASNVWKRGVSIL